MGHVDVRTLQTALQAVRDTVERLEQSLPSVAAKDREQLIQTLVAYDEAADELARLCDAHACISRINSVVRRGLRPD